MLKVKISYNQEARRFSVNKNSTFEEFKTNLAQIFGQNNASNSQIQYVDDEGDWILVNTELEWKHAVESAPLEQVFRVRVTAPQQNTSKREEKKPYNHFARRGGSCPFRHQRSCTADAPHQPEPCDVRRRRCSLWVPLANAFQQPQQQPAPSTAAASSSSAPAANNEWASMLNFFLGGLNNNQQSPQQPIHRHVICDGCQQRGIVGTRHKCNQCRDYDLCSNCHSNKDKFHDPSHTFRNIEVPTEHVKLQDWAQRIAQAFATNAQPEQQPQTPATQVPQQPAVIEKQEAPATVDVAPVQEQQPSAPVQEPVQPQLSIYPPIAVPSTASEPKEEGPKPQVQASAPIQDYNQEFEVLAVMGFTNAALNTHLLKHFKGNLDKVVESLLAME